MQEFTAILYENKSLVLNAVGLLGAMIYLFSYIRLTKGIYSGSERIFLLLNLLAALLVGMSLLVAFNAATAVIQISWFVATAKALLYQRKVPIKFSQVQKDSYIGQKHLNIFR